MHRRGFTLIEVLVTIAIIAVLIALLLAAVQRAREASRRAQCINNLKQLALAAQDYINTNMTFPPGLSPAPAQASSLVTLLPFLERSNEYNAFNLSIGVSDTVENATARHLVIAEFLCPSDPSQGAYLDPSVPPDQEGAVTGPSNYFGNLGTNGWMYEQSNSQTKPPGQCGPFAAGSATKIDAVADGRSNTALYAEVRRGANPYHDALDVTLVATNLWGPAAPPNNPGDLSPPAACDDPTQTLGTTGLQYQGGAFNAALYTHTVPPNNRGRDCLASPALDQGHVAARSAHPGGVNVALADGSVRFVRDSVALETWKALGTRAGGEALDESGY